MIKLRHASLLLLLATASCAGLERQDQGLLQPQNVSGPCQVKKFFLLDLRLVPTEMTVSNTGQACTFTVFNPAAQIITNAALITTPASHGQATAGLALAGTQAVASYTPQPGFVGTDKFALTLEPDNRGAIVNVTVQPAG
jgi:hypothetical protein